MTWIAVDWGTSALRASRMDGARAVETRASDAGMATLEPDGFEPALLALAEGWLGDGPTDVVVCGMAGARQGWREAPYRAVPCPPAGGDLLAVPAADARLRARIVPGLSQRAPHPDVMRGEETQLAGILARHPGFDGCACLPGTHTKWVHLSAGEVVSFQTAITGEVFALLAARSVLRHSLGADGWDDAAFDAALSDAMARPQVVLSRLFQIRAADLLSGQSPAAARATASGLLLGLELAGARPWWLGREVVVCGSDRTVPTYRRALEAQGVRTRVVPAGAATLAGLAAMRDAA